MAARSQNTVTLKFVADDKVSGTVSNIESTIDNLNNGLNSIATNQSLDFFNNLRAKIEEIGRIINDLATSGASFNLLSEGFESLSRGVGESADSIIEKLSRVSGAAISNRDLMLSANRALLLEVGENSDQLAQLLAISIERANKLGLSSTQAFNDIVTGLGRASPLILDNLGILVDSDAAYTKYAETLGKSVDELNKHERIQAFVNEVISTSTHLMDGVTSSVEQQAQQVASLSASWQNFYDNLASNLAPTLASLYGSLAEYLNILSKGIDSIALISDTLSTDNLGFKATSVGISGVIDGLRNLGIETEYTNEIQKTLGNTLKVISDNANTTTTNLNPLTVEQQLASQTADVLSQKEKEAADSAALFGESSKLASINISSMGLTATVAAGQIQDVTLALQSASQANAAFQSGASALQNQILSQTKAIQKLYGTDIARQLGASALEDLSYGVADLQKQIESNKISALDLTLTYGSMEGTLLAPFNSLIQKNKEQEEAAKKAAKETEQSYTSAYKEAQTAANQFYNGIESKVSGVLSESLNLGGLVNLDDILPRQDAVNESARKIADIAVHGYESPWVDFIKNKFPGLFSDDGDIKQQAAVILKNFQDGLVPELIDKETAKDRVRRALVGEQNMKDLATEIATELATEFGNVSASNIQSIANQTLGVKPKTEDVSLNSTDINVLGDSFIKGFKDSLGGITQSVMGILSEKLNAKELVESITNSGRLNGSSWGSGFLETVGEGLPARLIEILALAVLPNIEKLLAENGQRS